jgi:hypothetical protein
VYGPYQNDWKILWSSTDPRSYLENNYLLDFWKLVEDPQFLMPEGWVDSDDDDYCDKSLYQGLETVFISRIISKGSQGP